MPLVLVALHLLLVFSCYSCAMAISSHWSMSSVAERSRNMRRWTSCLGVTRHTRFQENLMDISKAFMHQLVKTSKKVEQCWAPPEISSWRPPCPCAVLSIRLFCLWWDGFPITVALSKWSLASCWTRSLMALDALRRMSVDVAPTLCECCRLT